MLKIQNLNFKFDEKVIFDNAELEIPKGKISIIMGANGAGKSTLLKIITNNMKAHRHVSGHLVLEILVFLV